MEKGISIILTAWNTQNYIKECLDSIMKQTFLKDKNYEILLGIDNCKKTPNAIKNIITEYKNLKVFFFKENTGTYVISNTLAVMAKYKYVLRFDTDDIMVPNMMEKLYTTAEKENADIVLGKYSNFKTDIAKREKAVYTIHGQIFIKKDTLIQYGGFRAYRCGADTELISRLEKFVKIRRINDLVFFRRLHSSNLTAKTDTGMNSDYRKTMHRFISYEIGNLLKTNNDAIIKCKTGTCYIVTDSGEILDNPVILDFTPIDAPDKFAEFLNLSKREQEIYANKKSFSYNTNANGYIRKKAQSPGWIYAI